VLKISPRTINLWTIGGVIKEGVRHIDDPNLNDEQIQTFGCWRLSETAEQLNAVTDLGQDLKARMTELTERLTVLEAAMSAKKRPPEDSMRRT